MSLQGKYQAVLELGEKMGATEGSVEEKDGKLHIGGTVKTQGQKNAIWDKIKAVGGGADDVAANIKVSGEALTHTVVSGDSLSKIAAAYYGDMSYYEQIFEANRDKLSSADNIKVGQVLILP